MGGIGFSFLVLLMALFSGETTAWEDIQVKMGNFAPRDPKGPSNDEIFVSTMDEAEKIAKQDFVDSILREEAMAVPEDLDLAAIRRLRLEQLMKQESQVAVRRITRESYLDEVTEGSKSAAVVVMMDRKGGDSFLETECKKLAKEWVEETAPSRGLESQAVRFYVGDVDDLIGVNFPSDQLPFAVVYAHGQCQAQLPRATTNGIRTTLLVAMRRETKPVTAQKDSSDLRKEIALRTQLRRRNSDSSDSADVSDDEAKHQRDKGYSSAYFAKNVLRH